MRFLKCICALMNVTKTTGIRTRHCKFSFRADIRYTNGTPNLSDGPCCYNEDNRRIDIFYSPTKLNKFENNHRINEAITKYHLIREREKLPS